MKGSVISPDSELAKEFDELIAVRGCQNRFRIPFTFARDHRATDAP
jgi:metal-responsive CopG/Arc/MetJ family transcriptional regulator